MSLFIPILSAFWLGIITSVSPCPLATNVAAISVLGRQAGHKNRAIFSALFYTAGRVAVYLILSAIIFFGVASMPEVASVLREKVLPFVGPVLILAGMGLMGWIPLPIDIQFGSADTAEKMKRWGFFGEFCLGALFAISFCPVSAALFFGSLLPMTLDFPIPALLVSVYGIGTAFPVAIIGVIIAISAEVASKALGKLQSTQKYLLCGTAIVLIVIGVSITMIDLVFPVFKTFE